MSSEYTGLRDRETLTLRNEVVYVDTTVRRWQQHTGGTPQRNGVPHSLEP